MPLFQLLQAQFKHSHCCLSKIYISCDTGLSTDCSSVSTSGDRAITTIVLHLQTRKIRSMQSFQLIHRIYKKEPHLAHRRSKEGRDISLNFRISSSSSHTPHLLRIYISISDVSNCTPMLFPRGTCQSQSLGRHRVSNI